MTASALVAGFFLDPMNQARLVVDWHCLVCAGPRLRFFGQRSRPRWVCNGVKNSRTRVMVQMLDGNRKCVIS